MTKLLIDRAVLEQALETFDCIYSPLHVREINKIGAAMAALRAALEQPQVEQEPIGEAHAWNNYTHCIWDARVVPVGTKLYTHPQPPRQPLTDEQIEERWGWVTGRTKKHLAFARSIERAHGIGEQE